LRVLYRVEGKDILSFQRRKTNTVYGGASGCVVAGGKRYGKIGILLRKAPLQYQKERKLLSLAGSGTLKERL